ncbi:MAG: prepilin-type N-terminal cleavage/methylation domain-containing protein [Methylococcales bacterium]|nr:prepilin-type N-terminal cleavage/methylation domain-containing protein [Methylococcales bacterium]MBT7411248.1 prepilin-type N-terminal cleavage/methylation domain-containing protein [Methylococcales bacterium]
MNKQCIHGFSLVELLVVVSILGILFNIVFPAYQVIVSKSYLDEAQVTLLQLSNEMVKLYSLNNTYQGAATAGNNTGSPALPRMLNLVTNANVIFYDLFITQATDSQFLLEIVPQTGERMADTGSFAIDHLGQKWHDLNNDRLYTTNELGWKVF